VWNKQLAEATTEEAKRGIRDVSDRAVQRLERHCRGEHWATPAIDCVKGGGRDCQATMTAEQWQKLQADPIK
jgi:hypothetical protein